MYDVVLKIFRGIVSSRSNAERQIGTPARPPLPMLCPTGGRKVKAKRFIQRRMIAVPRAIKLCESIKSAPELNRIELIGIRNTPPMDGRRRCLSSNVRRQRDNRKEAQGEDKRGQHQVGLPSRVSSVCVMKRLPWRALSRAIRRSIQELLLLSVE